MKTLSILGVGAVLMTLAACAANESVDSSESEYTRENGVMGQAPKLDFGQQKSGQISNGQIDVWMLDLKMGDKITVTETISRGTLTPDFGLFYGGFTHVASTSHDALPKKLTKNYVAASTGKHYIGIAAYQGRGNGDYKIKVACNGGPCAGQPVIVPLDDGQKNTCITKARECALDAARPASGGRVTITAAKAAWKTCLEGAMLSDGASCKQACDDGDAKHTCAAITKSIAFYAAKPAACAATLKSCMSDCIDSGDHSDISEQICMVDGFNNTCDGYARAHATCGGANQPGSTDECHSLCEATFGAWNDDLDTICEEQCPE